MKTKIKICEFASAPNAAQRRCKKHAVYKFTSLFNTNDVSYWCEQHGEDFKRKQKIK